VRGAVVLGRGAARRYRAARNGVAKVVDGVAKGTVLALLAVPSARAANDDYLEVLSVTGQSDMGERPGIACREGLGTIA
jgi:hypothetical protein